MWSSIIGLMIIKDRITSMTPGHCRTCWPEPPSLIPSQGQSLRPPTHCHSGVFTWASEALPCLLPQTALHPANPAQPPSLMKKEEKRFLQNLPNPMLLSIPLLPCWVAFMFRSYTNPHRNSLWNNLLFILVGSQCQPGTFGNCLGDNGIVTKVPCRIFYLPSSFPVHIVL